MADQISSGDTSGANAFTGAGGPGVSPGGPAAWNPWRPWNVSPSLFICPSSGTTYNAGTTTSINSYAMSVGDSIVSLRDTQVLRGVFDAYVGSKLGDVTDGTSNTLCFSERLRANFGISNVGANQVETAFGMATNVAGLSSAPRLCLATASGRYFNQGQMVKGRFGSLWTDGQAERVCFNSVLPPNSPSCTEDADGNADSVNMVIPASSRHTGGVNVGLCDGSVRFISQSIDTGNTAVGQPTGGPSNYGVWGALGSKSGGDIASLAD